VAISIDWIGASATIPYKARITIPQADLSFISGTLYELDTMAFWDEMKTNEEDSDGIVFNDLQAHNPDYTVAGVNYADAVFMLCEVTFENTGSNYSVILAGSNNDIFDEDNGILVATPGLTIIPTNAAGLIITDTSGLTPTESAALISIAADTAASLALQTGINARDIGKHITNPDVGKLQIVNDAAMRRWEADAWEDLAETIPYKGDGFEVVGELTEIAY
jgi:hypothetical protein